MNRGGFSWKRLVGVTRGKQRISKAIGVPVSGSGRQRKLGAAMGCSCYLLLAAVVLIIWR